MQHFVWVDVQGETFLFECKSLEEAERLMDKEERDADRGGYPLEMKLIVGEVLVTKGVGT